MVLLGLLSRACISLDGRNRTVSETTESNLHYAYRLGYRMGYRDGYKDSQQQDDVALQRFQEQLIRDADALPTLEERLRRSEEP